MRFPSAKGQEPSPRSSGRISRSGKRSGYCEYLLRTVGSRGSPVNVGAPNPQSSIGFARGSVLRLLG